MFIILPHYLAFISINALPILWYLLILISTFNPLTGPDTTRPVVTCPPDQTAVAAQGATSAVVTYNPMATTDDGSPINYSMLSGSSFIVNTPTIVYAFATDTALNTGFCMFTVTVTRKFVFVFVLNVSVVFHSGFEDIFVNTFNLLGHCGSLFPSWRGHVASDNITLG